ncbi:uncharacterized protein N7482_005842 [Penicillium canariense]|uniref:T6SS Phospholipase effector Tle1-like catalytic domain-containing protein n=1 Tax=Penicillium canariense TaxID=189055 RepID=A0A9W9I394_9EURO|nr:uncharacterized protein N7482_005842 [Penicillium canariense]KAJ5167061.1 hypothetical protein N7482_005842 [Penicillium canariense]
MSMTLGRVAPAEKPTKPLILLCDGTWCGREVDTKTNIYKLAERVGFDFQDDAAAHGVSGRVCYMEGVGLGSSFLDYIFNGVTAQDIARQCIEAYEFIVRNYTYPDHEIWMFGLSRGAYLVRAVAGMINNCGIVKPVNVDGAIDTPQTRLLCEAVYDIYRSPYPIDEPHSSQSQIFRRSKSWPLIGDEDRANRTAPRFIPPIKFMGLFDTVGSLGLPDFTGGVGLDWPAFYDQNISTAVENVYHAVSLHDRIYPFQPCLVNRNGKRIGVTKQEWLPGVHYDLGRQKFRFLREFGGGKLEQFLARCKLASKTVEPNHVLADFALRWMLLAIRAHNPQPQAAYQVMPAIDPFIQDVTSDIRDRAQDPGQVGDGDVYGRILYYAPFGSFILDIMRTLRGTRGKISAIYQLFFDLRDRLIPEQDATVYDFRHFDPDIGESIENLGEVSEQRYPSKSYAKWELWR